MSVVVYDAEFADGRVTMDWEGMTIKQDDEDTQQVFLTYAGLVDLLKVARMIGWSV